MDAILNHELYLYIQQYVEPGMLVMVPILLFFGWMMKSTPNIPNWVIPYINTIIAIGGGIVFVETVVDGFVQGILVSALATLVYSMYKQIKKKSKTNTKK